VMWFKTGDILTFSMLFTVKSIVTVVIFPLTQ